MRAFYLKLFFLASCCAFCFFSSFSQSVFQPKWSVIADSGSSICSPMVINNLVIVGSGWEETATSTAAMAIHLSDGSIAWKKKYSNQIIAISTPNQNKVIVAGRKGILSCLNYVSGQEIWRYNRQNFNHTHDSLRFNFYHPQWVNDVNNDGEDDLLCVYGGGSTAKNPYRPSGFLLLVDGANGNILVSDTMPDGKETFSTPVTKNNHVYFGTGGETEGGSFYKIAIDEFMQNGLKNAQVLYTDAKKGFINAPTFYYNIMLVPCLNEKIYAYNLQSQKTEFTITISGHEIYSSVHPTDSFLLFSSQEGNWPFYQGFYLNQYDLQGQKVHQKKFNNYLFTSPISLPNTSALLIAENKDLGFTEVDFNHRFLLINKQNITQIIDSTPFIPGVHLYSTPRSAFLTQTQNNVYSLDCENQGFVAVSGYDTKNYYQPKQFIVSHYTVKQTELQNFWNSFGGYLGNEGTGNYSPFPCINTQIQPTTIDNNFYVSIYPNPATHQINISTIAQQFEATIFSISGKFMLKTNLNQVDLEHLPNGMYILKVTDLVSGKMSFNKFTIDP